MQMLTLNEKTLNDATRASQAQAETARKQAATDAATRLRQAELDLVKVPVGKNRAEAAAAQARVDRATAELLENGRTPMEAAGLWADANKINTATEEGMADFLNTLKRLTQAAAKPTTAGAGLIGSIRFDGNGQPYGFTMNKNTGATRIVPFGQNDSFEGINKITGPAQTALTDIKTAYGMAEDLRELLETTKTMDGKPLKDLGGDSFFKAVGASVKQRATYQLYIRGIGNQGDPAGAVGLAQQVRGGAGVDNAVLDSILQYAALLKLMGVQPFMRGVRNQQYVNMIKVHLPNEEADTGAQMYHKLINLMPRWEQMYNDTRETALKPNSALKKKEPTPPRATPAPPAAAPAVPADGGSDAAKKLLEKLKLKVN
jgi:hypothetical protein